VLCRALQSKIERVSLIARNLKCAEKCSSVYKAVYKIGDLQTEASSNPALTLSRVKCPFVAVRIALESFLFAEWPMLRPVYVIDDSFTRLRDSRILEYVPSPAIYYSYGEVCHVFISMTTTHLPVLFHTGCGNPQKKK